MAGLAAYLRMAARSLACIALAPLSLNIKPRVSIC